MNLLSRLLPEKARNPTQAADRSHLRQSPRRRDDPRPSGGRPHRLPAGLLRLAGGAAGSEGVSQAGSLAEARTMLEGVDVALIDRGLPGGDGLELIGPLREVNPGARVYVISSTVEMLHPKDAIEAGAEGVIDKLDPPERVFAAMRGE